MEDGGERKQKTNLKFVAMSLLIFSVNLEIGFNLL